MNYFNKEFEYDDEFNPKELDFDIIQEEPMINYFDKYHSFCRLDQDFNLDLLGKRNYCLQSEEANECVVNKELCNKLNDVNPKEKAIDQISLDLHLESRKRTKEKCPEGSSTVIPSSEVHIEMNRYERGDNTNKQSKLNDSIGGVDSLSNSSQHSNIENPNIKRRFGRNEDRDMFEKLKSLCLIHNRNISEFWKSNETLDSELQEILDQIHLYLCFKGNKLCLLKRIQKIGLTTKFSVRERKLLKKLIIKQVIEGNINYNQIEYYFPGKTLELIKEEIVRMLHNI